MSRLLAAVGLSAALLPGVLAVAQEASSSSQGHTRVLFSSAAKSEGKQSSSLLQRLPANAPSPATEAERRSVAYLAYDLDIRLQPAEQGIAIRALLTVRNEGNAPLAHLPMQLSSDLSWERIRVQGKDLSASIALVPNDVDHTGVVQEAVVTLPEPLAPQKELKLDVLYSGKIGISHQRLDSIGTPPDMAARSDWDRISPEFVGLRGLGNVVWYPSTTVPAALGDGAKLFNLIADQKQRFSQVHFRMTVSQEFFGSAPTIAVLNGKVVSVQAPEKIVDPSVPNVATYRLEDSVLGYGLPSLFAAVREPHASSTLNLYNRAENATNTQSYVSASTMVTPLLKEWFGETPHSPLTIIDLPEPEDMPFEAGDVLFLPLVGGETTQLAGRLISPLTHAWFASPFLWQREGLAQFMSTVWIEQQKGREYSLAGMESARHALALDEVSSPQDGPGQPLVSASNPIFFRTKAAYVFWMLRDIVGERPLKSALHDYHPGANESADALEKLIEKNAKDRDLRWFFDDWVYNDKGLPDLAISNVFTNSAAAQGIYLAAIDMANDGWVAVEVPVTVQSKETSVTERVLIPAHQKLVHRIVLQGYPQEVRVNDGAIPEAQSSVHTLTIKPPAVSAR